MKRKILITISLLAAVGYVFGQGSEYKGLPSTTWPILYKVDFETVEDEFGEYQKPIFSSDVKETEGKEIYIEGYIIPFDGSSSTKFVLSALPVNACFFCGNGGPESVIQIYAKDKIRFNEKPVELKGILKLNPDNPDELIYSLVDAELNGVLDFFD